MILLPGLIPSDERTDLENLINAAVPMVQRHLEEARAITFDLEEADLASEATIKVDYRQYALIVTATEGVDGIYVHLMEVFDEDAPGVDGIRTILADRLINN